MENRIPKGLFPKWQIFIALFPALLLFSIFTIFPAVANIFFSFTDYRPFSEQPTRWIWFDNYISIMIHGNNFSELLQALRNTAVIAGVISLVQNILAVLFAVLLNNRIKCKNIYRAIIFLPLTLGIVIQGLIWTLALDPYQGTIAQLLSKLGFHSSYFGDSNIAIYLVIMIIIWANVGFAMTIYLAGLQAIPQELYEAGIMDGAAGWNSFKHITLPLLGQAVTVNVLLTIIGGINQLAIIIVTTNGGPGRSTNNLPFYIFNGISKSGNGAYSQGYFAAITLVQFLITFVVVIIGQYFLRRREVEI